MKEKLNLRVEIGIIIGFLIQVIILIIVFLQPPGDVVLNIPLIESNFFRPISQWEINIGGGISIGYDLCWSLIVFFLPGIITGLICGKNGWLYALIIAFLAMLPNYMFLLSIVIVIIQSHTPFWHIDCLDLLIWVISNLSFAALYGLIGSFLHKLIDSLLRLKKTKAFISNSLTKENKVKVELNLRVETGIIIIGFLIQAIILIIIFLLPPLDRVLCIPLIDPKFLNPPSQRVIMNNLCWNLIVFSWQGILAGLIWGKKGWLYALMTTLLLMWYHCFDFLCVTLPGGLAWGAFTRTEWYIGCLKLLIGAITLLSFAAFYGLIGSFLHKLIVSVVRVKRKDTHSSLT